MDKKQPSTRSIALILYSLNEELFIINSSIVGSEYNYT